MDPQEDFISHVEQQQKLLKKASAMKQLEAGQSGHRNLLAVGCMSQKPADVARPFPVAGISKKYCPQVG